MLYVKLAVRNVFRNKRRTFITELVIVIGMISMIFIGGILTRMSVGWGDALIQTNSGHLSVIRSDYLELKNGHPLDLALTRYQDYYQKIDKLPNVESCAAKLDVGGIIVADGRATTFFGYGLDLSRQKKTLPKAFQNIVDGKGLDPADPSGIVVGVGVAKSLGKKVGEEINLTSMAISGRPNTMRLRIRGTVKNGEGKLDDNLVVLPLDTAEKLVDVKDFRASEVIIRLKDDRDVDKSREEIIPALASAGKNITVKTWIDMNPMFRQVKGMFDGIASIVVLILFITVGASVANTMLMSVFERVEEIGTVRAIGMSSRGIVLLFILEGLFVGIIGAVIGLALGYSITSFAAWIGIPLPVPGTKELYRVRPIIQMMNLEISVGIVILMSVLASLFPAFHASKLAPAEALRKN